MLFRSATHAGLGIGHNDDAFVEDEGERGRPLLVVHHLLGRLLESIKLPTCVECGELKGELVGREEATELVAARCGSTEVVLEGRECQAPSI